jgi:hypothetical protein
VGYLNIPAALQSGYRGDVESRFGENGSHCSSLMLI